MYNVQIERIYWYMQSCKYFHCALLIFKLPTAIKINCSQKNNTPDSWVGVDRHSTWYLHINHYSLVSLSERSQRKARVQKKLQPLLQHGYQILWPELTAIHQYESDLETILHSYRGLAKPVQLIALVRIFSMQLPPSQLQHNHSFATERGNGQVGVIPRPWKVWQQPLLSITCASSPYFLPSYFLPSEAGCHGSKINTQIGIPLLLWPYKDSTIVISWNDVIQCKQYVVASLLSLKWMLLGDSAIAIARRTRVDMGGCISCKRQYQDGEEVVSSGKVGKKGHLEEDQSQMTMVQSDVHHNQHFEQNDGDEVHL